jgi:hypothetical protein
MLLPVQLRLLERYAAAVASHAALSCVWKCCRGAAVAQNGIAAIAVVALMVQQLQHAMQTGCHAA